MKFYVLRLVDWLPNALSGDNNFTDAGQLVICHDNEVTLEHYQCSSAMSYFTDAGRKNV
jgi:hypothetical protein